MDSLKLSYHMSFPCVPLYYNLSIILLIAFQASAFSDLFAQDVVPTLPLSLLPDALAVASVFLQGLGKHVATTHESQGLINPHTRGVSITYT
jgi:hypothetical protein